MSKIATSGTVPEELSAKIEFESQPLGGSDNHSGGTRVQDHQDRHQEQDDCQEHQHHYIYQAACDSDVFEWAAGKYIEEKGYRNQKLPDVGVTLDPECSDIVFQHNMLTINEVVYATQSPCKLTPWESGIVLSCNPEICQVKFPSHQQPATLPLTRVAYIAFL